MLTDMVPTNSQFPPNDSGHYFVGIWNIGTKYYLLSPMCDNVGGCGLSVYSRAIFELPSDTWNSISIDLQPANANITLNDVTRTLPIGSAFLPTGVFFGNPEITGGSQHWSDFYVDNFAITYFSNIIPTFPYLSQKDPLWASQEYDSASRWANPGANNGIDRWGCAITSVAMILQNYGVQTPTGEAVDPQKLNDWLKIQPDGYIGNGLLNWLAITRYAKLSRDLGHSPTSLEFTRSTYSATTSLPAILGESGHFVVAHTDTGTDFSINDPSNVSRTTLAKSSDIRTSNVYTPSNTDLSYIFLTADPGSSVVLKNGAGDTIPLDWTNEYLSDDVGGDPSPALQTALLPKPDSGTYTAQVHNPSGGTQDFGVYLYDAQGEVAKTEWNIAPSETKILEIDFDKSDASQSATTVPDTTPPAIPVLVSPVHNSATNSATVILDWEESTELATYTINILQNNAPYSELSTATESAYTISLPDSSYSWKVMSCDLSDNCSDWSEVWEVTVDTTVPAALSAPMTTPAPTNLLSQDWTWLSATDIGTGILGYSTRTYDARAQEYLSDWFWLGDVLGTNTSLGEGEWWLSLKATDNAGNESEAINSDILHVDITTPMLTSQTVFADTWFNAAQTVTFTYSDPYLLSDYIDPICEITTESTASYCWVKPYICDMAGNCNNEQVFSQDIKLDFTKPTVTLNVWGRELIGQASDALSGVSKVVLEIKNPDGSSATVAANGTTHWNHLIDNALLGSYNVRITAYDQAGNASDTILKSYTIGAANTEANISNSSVPASPVSSPSPSPVVLGSTIIGDDLTEVTPAPSSNSSAEEILGDSDAPKIQIKWWIAGIGVVLLILGIIFVSRF